MPITDKGRDLWANALSNVLNGYTSTSTATTSSTLTKTGAGWSAEKFVGQDVYATTASGLVVGTVVSNTTEALTVARWETVGSRGGAAGETPEATGKFVIASGASPALWMALSKSASFGTPVAGEVASAWKEEVFKSGGGLNRQMAVWAHTAGTNEYTVTQTFTANGSDELPVTVFGIGIFNIFRPTGGELAGQRLLYRTKLATSATLSSSGDSVAITDTVTGS